MCYFFFQAEDGILDLVRARGLVDGCKRQCLVDCACLAKRLWSLADAKVVNDFALDGRNVAVAKNGKLQWNGFCVALDWSFYLPQATAL
mgnify:CR=1 FL=1